MQLSVDNRNTLFDVLKKIEVDADIPIAKFIKLVANLDTDLVCNMLCFQESELPSEDVIEKNLGLCICINIDGSPIKKILIDIGSNVNINLCKNEENHHYHKRV